MNLKDAIASTNVEDRRDPLMAEEWWELFRARAPRQDRLDRQIVNRGQQDNRLDVMPSLVDQIEVDGDEAMPPYDAEAEAAQYETDFPDFDPRTGMYKNNAEFTFPEDALEGGAMHMKTPRSHGFEPNYAGASGLNEFDAGSQDGQFQRIMEKIFGNSRMEVGPNGEMGEVGVGTGGVGGDGSIRYYDQMLNSMKGRDMGMQDIEAFLGEGMMQPGGGPMDPNVLVEQALAAKVAKMLDAGGVTGKYQGQLGSEGPRRKSGKGEQKVKRKLKGQADKGNRETNYDRD